MAPTRVLVIDDSLVARRIISEVIDSDPRFRVVATACDGKTGLELLNTHHPEIVTLDVEMPVMDGLETLAAVRNSHPEVRVIMVSSLTEAGARATLDALAMGAVDYVTKPTYMASLSSSTKYIRKELLPRLSALSTPRANRPSDDAGTVAATSAQRRSKLQRPVRASAGPVDLAPGAGVHVSAVAIAASTGGPNLISSVVAGLPAEFPVPVVIVQHMPALFTRLFANRLNSNSPATVVEATECTVVRPGTVYLAPGDHHMLVERRDRDVWVYTNQAPPRRSCRPAADYLFESVADVYGSACLGVVLTGMGSDGLDGAERIRACGGQVIVQDKQSSVVWGMPGAVVKADLANRVVAGNQLLKEILQRAMPQRSARKFTSRSIVEDRHA